MCVHATQGMCIVLTHTWSASTAYCIPQGYHALYTDHTCTRINNCQLSWTAPAEAFGEDSTLLTLQPDQEKEVQNYVVT